MDFNFICIYLTPDLAKGIWVRFGKIEDWFTEFDMLVSCYDNLHIVVSQDEFDEKESALQKELVDVRGSKSRLEEGERMKRTMVVKNENEIKNLNLQLSKVAASAAKLDDLKRALKRAVSRHTNIYIYIYI